MSQPEPIWSPPEPVTLEVIKICLQLKKDIEERIKNPCAIYMPLIFRTVKDGDTFYVVKVYVGNDECFHAIKVACDGQPICLEGVKYPAAFDDPLDPGSLKSFKQKQTA